MIEQGVYSSQTPARVNDAFSWEAPSQEHEISSIDVLPTAYREWRSRR